jgi:hypothetical protein
MLLSILPTREVTKLLNANVNGTIKKQLPVVAKTTAIHRRTWICLIRIIFKKKIAAIAANITKKEKTPFMADEIFK